MSKIKVIVEIEKRTYDLLKEKPDNIAERIIANGTPYNPTGDCISRELLKKDIEAQISDFNELNKKGEPYKDFKDIRAILFGLVIGKNLIDNALPVEITEEMAINKLHETGWLIGHDKEMTTRPQGEWKTIEGIDGDDYYECSNCGEPWVLMAGTPKDNNMNFCPNCGADMRKGGAE